MESFEKTTSTTASSNIDTHSISATETELEHHIFLKILVTQDIHTLEIPSIEKKVFTLYKDAMLQTVRSYHCH